MEIQIIERFGAGFVKRVPIQDKQGKAFKFVPLTIEEVEDAQRVGRIYNDRNSNYIDYETIKASFPVPSTNIYRVIKQR